MPKLSGIEDKYLYGYKVDKENEDAIFNDEKHVYIDKTNGEPFISVTTLIHQYANEFDEQFWGSYKALEYFLEPEIFATVKNELLTTKKFKDEYLEEFDLNPDIFNKKKAEIIEGYHNNRDEACAHGTYVHALMEESFYGKTHFDLSGFGCDTSVGKYNCKKNYYKLDLEYGIYPEFLIALTSKDGELKLAGQVDLIVKEGNDISILDWKTNKEIKKTSYYDKSARKNVAMKFPLNNIQDCNYWHYALQLSLYAYMLQQINPKFNIKKLAIVHINREGKQTVYDIPYLKTEVIRMLQHYKKQKRVNAQLAKCQPIKIG